MLKTDNCSKNRKYEYKKTLQFTMPCKDDSQN